MAVPQDLFDGEVPNRDSVLDQGFWFDPVDRKRRLPDDAMWPPELDECPSEGKNRFVDRRTVFDIAQRAIKTPDDHFSATQILVASIIWGTGPRGRNAGFRLDGLHQDPDAPRKLTNALHIVRASGAKSAFEAMSWGGSCKVIEIAAAFFTKFLYFGGWDAKPYLWQPLIMDERVIRALNRTTGREWDYRPTGQHYSDYLDLVKDWAYELETSEDVIERRLFQLGEKRRAPRKR
jgi:hypothetical protein